MFWTPPQKKFLDTALPDNILNLNLKAFSMLLKAVSDDTPDY